MRGVGRRRGGGGLWHQIEGKGAIWYIISEEGKRFKLRLDDERVNPTVSLSCRLRIDGLE